MQNAGELGIHLIGKSIRFLISLRDRPTLLIALAFLVLVLGMLFMIKPARTGYAFVKEFEMNDVDAPQALQKMETLNANNARLEKELKSTKALVEDLRDQLAEKHARLSTSQQETQDAESKLKLLQQDLDGQIDRVQTAANVNVDVARSVNRHNRRP